MSRNGQLFNFSKLFHYSAHITIGLAGRRRRGDDGGGMGIFWFVESAGEGMNQWQPPQEEFRTNTGYSKPQAEGQPWWLWPAVGGGGAVLLLVVVLVALMQPARERPAAGGGEGQGKQAVGPGPMSVAVQTTRTGKAVRPAPPAPPGTVKEAPAVEVLDLIDTKQHSVLGFWKFVDEKLVSPSTGTARLRIPYQPPEEYRATLKVQRTNGDGALNLVLVSGERQFAVLLDARRGRVSGLQLVDDRTVMGNPTTFDGSLFTNHQTARVVCEVRHTGVKVWCDDRVIVTFPGPLSRLTMEETDPPMKASSMYLGSSEASYLISQFSIQPLPPSSAAPIAPIDPPPATPSPSGGPRRTLADLVQASREMNWQGPAPPQKKAPVPSDDVLQATEKEVKEERFAGAFGMLQSAAERHALAAKLLAAAREEGINTPARYIMYQLCAEQSGSTGNLGMAWQALWERSLYFDESPFLAQRHLVLQIAPHATHETELSLVSEALVALVGQAIGMDDYDAALSLADESAKLAERLNDPALQSAVAAGKSDLQELRQAYLVAAPARATLLTSPTDAAANLAWGRFLCLQKRDFAGGLPHLAAGQDVQLAGLAKEDLSQPSDALSMSDLADRWWQVAQAQQGIAKKGATLRAGFWYAQVVAKLEGADRQRVEQRLGEANELELNIRRGQWSDVLRWVDAGQHSLAGNWFRRSNEIGTLHAESFDRVQVPIALSGSYDLQMRFTRVEGIQAFGLILPCGPTQGILWIGGDGSQLEFGTQKVAQGEGSLPNTQLHLLEVHILPHETEISVDVLLNGQTQFSWKGPLATTPPPAPWALPHAQSLGLVTQAGNSLLIHSLRLKLTAGRVLAIR